MATGRSFTLNTGAKIPAVGLGTWQSAPNEVYEAVLVAIKTGYRHIDTAFVYGNEAEVGKAIADSGVPREELFVTTKLWCTDHSKAAEALDVSLKNLGLDYVDLYLMHWPVSFAPGESLFPTLPDGSTAFDKSWDFCKTWELMQKLPKEKARAIGISNFSTVNLNILLESSICKVIPAVNQVELHPYLPQHKLLALCKEKGIHVTAYSPLGSTSAPLQNEPVVKAIAEKLGKTSPQILISWAVSRGTSVLPKSVTPDRVRSNFEDIVLSSEDVDAISQIYKTTQKRVVKPNWGIIFHDDDF
ncbi:NADP-dependent oxidoreductase domain-containing protein [Lipomyces oligophaga]|uniref:NADP-dependent oxidoreductase domain-containing protein n=1 Tax=Lipomyces oligophaga TaxID=45792 RepID=UPI0034CF3BF0